MLAAIRLTEGLLIAHVCLLLAFLLGASIFPFWKADPDVSPEQAMMRAVTVSAAGFSIFGLGVFLLGSLALLTPLFLALTYLAFFFAGAWCSKAKPFTADYWLERITVLGRCWNGQLLFIYYVLLALALPAIIPNLSGSDPVNYHLAYAEDWARSHKLVVDPYLRSPFYANNGVLFYAALIELNASLFVNFITWALGVLCALAVCSSIQTALRGRAPTLAIGIIAVALTLAVLLHPTFLRWFDTAYIDVAIGAFALLAVVPIQLAVLEKNASWLAICAVIAGFFIGLKGSFLILAPLYFLAIIFACRALMLPLRGIALVVSLFLLTSSPWYVRNLILAGDPTPPILNLMTHGTDGIVTKDEFQLLARDLTTIRGRLQIALIPVRAYATPLTIYFREWGVNLLFVALYLPPFGAFISFCCGRRVPADAAIPIFVFAGLVAYWIASSTLLRYALLFYPLLAVCVAFALRPLLAQGRRRAYVFALLAILSILPNPVARAFYRDTWRGHYVYLPSDYSSETAYLDRFSDGYSEAAFAMDYVLSHRIGGAIYVAGKPGAYYFRQRGIISMGDWTGPAGYFRLYRSIDAGEAAEFLDALGAKSLLMDPSSILGGLDVPLERQLLAAGYCDVLVRGSRYRLLVNQHGGCSSAASSSAVNAL